MRTTYEQLLANLRKWATNMGPSTLAAVTLLHDSDWLKSHRRFPGCPCLGPLPALTESSTHCRCLTLDPTR